MNGACSSATCTEPASPPRAAAAEAAVDGDTVTVDGNHPLAGRTVEALVEVVDVRLATPEEQQFGLG